jgi:predicted phage baseplate assembly protein
VALPAPNLDDRRFQQLVDDAKRLVQRNCPEWTDHNVSDPGITLIEAFAFMVDQLLYRLNRVPERNYVKFLDLIGIKLYPPTAAKVPVTFWLSAPRDENLEIPKETRVSTRRSEALEPVTFSTLANLPIVHVELERTYSEITEGDFRDHTLSVETKQPFFCFDRVPKPGDAMYLGLSDAAPSNAVQLRFDCRIEGVGVNPTDPPIVWEAFTNDGWLECDLERDTTGGLNRPGEIVVHINDHHVVSVLDGQRAGWIRCRVTPPHEFQPFYSASPRISSVTADTIGGTAIAVNADLIVNEVVGEADGTHHQEFRLAHAPVVPSDDPVILEISDDEEGWTEWQRVSDFAASGPDDRHFTLDETAAMVRFGPAVVDPKGGMMAYGAAPGKGSIIRVPQYRTGGGRQGSVSKGTITVLNTSIPYVARVENRRGATGGVDGETIEDAKLRGPILLRTRDRAVTAEDFVHLAKDAAPEVARVRAITVGEDTGAPGGDASGVRVLIVPWPAQDEIGRIRFEDLDPPDDLKRKIADYLDERRVIGTRINVESARYNPFSVIAQVRARSKSDPMRVERDCIRQLYRYFHPVEGGTEGKGWPFGRPVARGEVYAVLQRVRGVELVEECLLFPADPQKQERGREPTDRLMIGRHALPYSYEHQVRVLPPLAT